MSLRKILVEDPRQTEFQKQSLSERLEVLRQLGYQQDKVLESDAFLAADRQRMDEIRQRQFCKEVVKSHQKRLKSIWQSHIDVKKAPESKFYLPGPGAYEGKNYIRDEPSFAVHKFQQTARPFNKVNMKEQTELIEYM